MRTQQIFGWKQKFVHVFMLYGAACSGVVNDLDDEGESWLGIG